MHTYSMESVRAVPIRSIHRTWHHVSAKHLHRHVNQTTFRHNDGDRQIHVNDRIDAMLAKSFGVRITHKEGIA